MKLADDGPAGQRREPSNPLDQITMSAGREAVMVETLPGWQQREVSTPSPVRGVAAEGELVSNLLAYRGGMLPG